MHDDIIILVHGFNRGRRDMARLAAGLARQGWNTRSLRLPTLFGDMDACVGAMQTQLEEIEGRYRRVHFVAHSLGGLITLNYIRKTRPRNIGRCVFIATPHGGSRLAQIASRIPGYARVFRPVAELLPTAAYDNCHAASGLCVGVIAGYRNSGVLGRLFLSSHSDGRVEVASALAGGATDSILLPYGHQEIHQQQETCEQVQAFLSKGTFNHRD
ncbi:esterase/lipase family protein [Marinobacterium rhizophilum]|uniref:Alpha/beta fold hydrolase n=1 Tax=Marinobacterium rhizophilum TaxID=420402 RepID=A0ABY5HK89_9GAMM|nr:alpha/beta fold hydrolase [Marinobacterium rhizophilum]UTW11660.1 alpha/beta fold hydrolase [Marinobacterium rhizophilum]